MPQRIVKTRNGVEKLNFSCFEVAFQFLQVNPINASFNRLIVQTLSNQEAIHPMVGWLFDQDFLGLAWKGNLREDKQGLLGPRSQYKLVSLAVEGLVKEELVNGLP